MTDEEAEQFYNDVINGKTRKRVMKKTITLHDGARLENVEFPKGVDVMIAGAGVSITGCIFKSGSTFWRMLGIMRGRRA